MCGVGRPPNRGTRRIASASGGRTLDATAGSPRWLAPGHETRTVAGEMLDSLSAAILALVETVRPGSRATLAWPGSDAADRRGWARVIDRHLRIASGQEAPGHATASQVEARIRFYGGRCWRCRTPANSIDHVVPLRLGGTNWPANLRPVCYRCSRRRMKSSS